MIAEYREKIRLHAEKIELFKTVQIESSHEMKKLKDLKETLFLKSNEKCNLLALFYLAINYYKINYK
jgi:hypothetical protein